MLVKAVALNFWCCPPENICGRESLSKIQMHPFASMQTSNTNNDWQDACVEDTQDSYDAFLNTILDFYDCMEIVFL